MKSGLAALRSPTSRWAIDRNLYMGTAFAYDPSINEEIPQPIRSDIASMNGVVTAGLDVPFDRLMVGRFLAQNGSSFRRARDSYQRTVLTHLVPRR